MLLQNIKIKKMNFESHDSSNIREKNTFSPERASEGVSILEDIKKLENGEGALELTEEERKKILEFEKELGIELEKIFNIKIVKIQAYPEYFLTEKGKNDFKETWGIDVQGESVEKIEEFILENQNIFKNIKPKERSAFFGRARSFSERKLFRALKKRIGDDGELDINNLENPVMVGLLMDPKKALKKIELLREFRKKIKKEKEAIDNNEAGNIKIGKEKILEIYRRKSNQMLIEEFPAVVLVKNKAEKIGEDNLSEDEKSLLKLFSGLSQIDKSYSRFDRWIHGSSGEYNNEGNREQISPVLKRRAEEIKELYIENEINKDDLVKEKGLDPKKVLREKIKIEEIEELANDILEQYGQKSSMPASKYDPDREGAAPDEKWQFIPRSEIKSMEIDSKQKVIKSSNKDRLVVGAISIALGHEFVHFVQALNREKLNLQMFKKVGSDRASIFAEMGAMMVQDKISFEAFGIHLYPIPCYVLAMIKKLEGGDYLDCVKEYYETFRIISLKKQKKGSIDKNKFQKELRKNLKVSINGTKRLFRGGVGFDSRSKYLSKSKDTVYLEQFFLAREMQKAGLEKYAFLGGMNLNTIINLLELGFIKKENIQEPKYYALEIWNRIKDRYKLDESDKKQS